MQKAIAARGMKQAQAARMLKVTQPRVSDVLRGRVNLYSTDMLIDMLALFGTPSIAELFVPPTEAFDPVRARE
jgi:predicted XRE-type DNA-binding protein